MARIEIITIILVSTCDKNSHEFYDVDMFITDIRKIQWKSIFQMDPEFLVDFNCACMAFCHQDKHFGLAGQVIVFSELSNWASEVFNG